MGDKAKRLLHRQYVFGWMMAFLLTPLYYAIIRLAGYSIRNIREVRRQSLALFKEHRGPWMICSNHLTMIDSVILAYALFPVHRCVFQYNLLPWNLPERANFQRNFLLTFLCYVNKCIPVSRGGDRDEMKLVLETCLHLLHRGQNLMIFPKVDGLGPAGLIRRTFPMASAVFWKESSTVGSCVCTCGAIIRNSIAIYPAGESVSFV